MMLFLAVLPSIKSKPENKTIIEGSTVTLYCNATSNPAPKITWTKDGNIVGTNDSLSFEAKRNHSGKYWCSADNGLSEPANASADVDVQCMYQFIVVTFGPFFIMSYEMVDVKARE